MTKNAGDMLTLRNGNTVQPLKAAQLNTFKAQVGDHYRITKHVDEKEQLLDDVIATRSGDDLHLSYADGTQVTLESYYVECKTAACDVTLPNHDAGEYLLSGQNTQGAALSDGSTLVYAHGNQDALMQMTQGDSALHAALASITGTEITYTPVAATGGMGAGNLELLGGGLGAAALAGGGGGGGGGIVAVVDVVADNIVSGSIVAGPIIPGNDLTVKLYKSDGTTLLGTGVVNSNGSFSINVGRYSGAVIAKLENGGSGNDYIDETTGLAHDISANLMSVGIAQTGTVTLNINALTTIAATKAGAVFSGASATTITPTTVTANNAAVAAAFGLTNLTGTVVVTTVDATGSANANYTPNDLTPAEKYGAILAALSGVDAANAGNMQTTINNLVSGLTVTGSTATLSTTALDAIIVGANTAASNTGGTGATLLTGVVSDLLAKTSASVSIDDIAVDNTINNGEQSATITGTTVAGATVNLSIGGNTRAATVSGTTWSYTLIGGDITAMGEGGETITATANLSGGGSATATRIIVVDTQVPSVVITDNVSGTAHGDITYTFTFSDPVTGFDASDVTLSTGTKGTFTAISSSQYTLVVSPPASGAGTLTVDVAANAAQDSAGNDSTIATQSSQAYNTTPLTVSGIAITSATGIQNSTLNVGDVVSVTVTMSDNADVTGTPQLALNIGGTTVQANYASGSGTTALVFTYTIQSGQTDANGISIGANSLTLNGGTLVDYTSNPATPMHSAVTDNSGFLVDTTTPTVSSVAISSATGIQNSTLNAGDVVSVTVTMSEATTVTGTPQLALNIGGTTVQANYASGTGTTALVFTYTIQSGQTDANGISIATNSLTLNSGTLSDAAGNAATLTHSAVSDNSSFLVDTTVSTVSSVAISSATGIQNSTLNAGDVVSVTVTMSEATTVTGTPQLALTIGGATVQASYASGSGTTALVFQYTILASQTDANGITRFRSFFCLTTLRMAEREWPGQTTARAPEPRLARFYQHANSRLAN